MNTPNASETNMNYYYNQMKGESPWRNNLIYTSLINDEKTVFTQWFHNDSEYHMGQNEVIDQSLMDEKWGREVEYLSVMKREYPHLVPEIIDINHKERKLYLKIDGPDLWQRSLDLDECSFDKILPDWEEQMLNIMQAHKDLGLYKYSLHPNSYFVVDGKLKSINYFFTYPEHEETVRIKDFISHISHNRRKQLIEYSEKRGIQWDHPTSLLDIQLLAFDSFRSNYPSSFIDKAQEIYRCTQ
jgi:hypothetical protein